MTPEQSSDNPSPANDAETADSRDVGRSPEEPDEAEGGQTEDDEGGDKPRIIVTGPRGLGIAEQDGDKNSDPTSAVEEPAKVMRLGSMIKQLLEEVRRAPLDDAARDRLAHIHEQSLTELKSGLSEELADELHRIALPFKEDQTPSDAELRVAKAQLVGWLEGLFHGIQTTLVAQQMAAQSQLSQMRRGLPPGASGQMPPGLMVNRDGNDSDRPSPGQYL